MSARVLLGQTLVGVLRPSPAAGEVAFEFDGAYAASAARPVLGRWFEDQIIDPPRTFRGAPLPSFFRNLLPEGALRKIVEKRLGSSTLMEYSMLLRLGENLPGAVRVLSDQLELGLLEESERRNRKAGDPFRFALTGMQPKLALSEVDDRLTVPLEGEDGYWIAKLGSPGYRHLVENERVVLDWARECGLNVPEHRVIRAAEIANLPGDFEPEQDVLIVQRFDRGKRGVRVHQEDFAQIFNIAPEERYATQSADLGWAHYGSISAVIHAMCGEEDHREYMRRLVFMVLSGNADAHLKNWAVVYPDGLRARLAPVYDFVSTVVYENLWSHSALRWWEPPEPTLEPAKPLVAVTMEDLLGAASYTPVDTSVLVDDLSDFGQTVRETWESVAPRAPELVRQRVTAHLHAAQLK
ncbi:MAG: type II toxin-antitoxin system HipA family toxin [Myxococcales bacterium]|nr:type II toxin-antitoxin system HipA family toxin [Myxococcales bacterium]